MYAMERFHKSRHNTLISGNITRRRIRCCTVNQENHFVLCVWLLQ